MRRSGRPCKAPRARRRQRTSRPSPWARPRKTEHLARGRTRYPRALLPEESTRLSENPARGGNVPEPHTQEILSYFLAARGKRNWGRGVGRVGGTATRRRQRTSRPSLWARPRETEHVARGRTRYPRAHCLKRVRASAKTQPGGETYRNPTPKKFCLIFSRPGKKELGAWGGAGGGDSNATQDSASLPQGLTPGHRHNP